MAYYRPLTISQNIVFPNKIATSSQSAQSIPAAYVFLMALIWLVKIWYHKMDGLRSIPVPQVIPVLVESDIRVAYKYHHISTIPYSKQPWYHCSMISLFSWKYGMVLWLLLKMGDPKSPLVVRLKTAHFGWTNDSEIREQIINQTSFIRYILSTYIPICLRIKAP